MNTTKSFLALSVVALVAPLSQAQVLSDFGAFYNPDYTFFSGDWSSSDSAPIASFSQGAGFYEIKGGTNNSLSNAEMYFGSAGDYTNLTITGDYLTVSAQLLSGNAATSFTVYLVDESTNYVSTTFLASSFTSGGFTSVSGALSSNPFFNAAAVSSFIITGDATGGAAAFNIAFDNLAVTTSAVPEPSVFALGAGAAALLGAIFRRRRRE